MKKLLLLQVLFGAVAAFADNVEGVRGTAYDLLVPRPVKAEASGGAVDLASVPVRSVRGGVPGAPAAVAEEAYMLEIGEKEVVATAPDPRGERYARVTLDQLRALGGGRCASGQPAPWRDGSAAGCQWRHGEQRFGTIYWPEYHLHFAVRRDKCGSHYGSFSAFNSKSRQFLAFGFAACRDR